MGGLNLTGSKLAVAFGRHDIPHLFHGYIPPFLKVATFTMGRPVAFPEMDPDGVLAHVPFELGLVVGLAIPKAMADMTVLHTGVSR